MGLWGAGRRGTTHSMERPDWLKIIIFGQSENFIFSQSENFIFSQSEQTSITGTPNLNYRYYPTSITGTPANQKILFLANQNDII
jgi:hypothetical protein